MLCGGDGGFAANVIYLNNIQRKQNIIFYDHKDENSTRRYKCVAFNLIQGDKEHVRSMETFELTNIHTYFWQNKKIARKKITKQKNLCRSEQRKIKKGGDGEKK